MNIFELLKFFAGIIVNKKSYIINLYQYLPALLFPLLFINASHHSFEFEQISIEQGLSQSIVQDILQDQQGFLWFCTEDGLNIYDGYQYKVISHQPENPNSLSHNYVLCIHQDQEGIFWIGTFHGGLNRYDPYTGKFTRFRFDNTDESSLSNDIVRAIHEDNSGNLWIGTENGLNKFNKTSGTFIRYLHNPSNPTSISHNSIKCIYEDKAGNLWIGTEGGGLNRMISQDPPIFFSYQHNSRQPGSLSHNIVRALFEDSTGTLWIGTYGGGISYLNLNELNGNGPQEPPAFNYLQNQKGNINSLSSDLIIAINSDRKGNLWVGTDGGGLNQLSLYERENQTSFQIKRFLNDPINPFSLSDNHVLKIFEDSAGILWFGTYGGGLSKYNPRRQQFNHVTADSRNPNSLSHKVVWNFLLEEDREKEILWVGTHGGGLNRFDSNTRQWMHFLPDKKNKSSIPHNVIRKIYKDREGTIWLGTGGGGICRMDDRSGKFTSFQNNPEDPSSLNHNDIRDIFQDSHGNLWIGTYGGGLDKYDSVTGAFRHFTSDPGDSGTISSNYVRVIHEDRKGRFWIGTQGGGLNCFDRESGVFQHFLSDPHNPNTISNDYIFSIYEDSDGILWIGTWGGGLNRFDPDSKTFSYITEKDGLADDEIYGILQDESGYLWLSSNNGITVYDPTSGYCKNYGVLDGLQSKEFNGGAYYKSKDGRMFLGGINGFNTFYPKDIVDNSHLPPIVITDFLKFNTSVLKDQPTFNLDEVHLSYRDYFFQFEFAALDYAAPEQNQYAYKMEGLDDDWIYTNAQKRFASYTTLPSGKYTFRVRGSNNHGVWNDAGPAISLIIAPPFWQTWWFRMLGIIVLVSISFYIYNRRMGTLEKRRQDLEQRYQEKTKAASTLQEALSEVEILKNRLQAENIYLQDEIKIQNNFKNIIGQSEILKQVFYQIEQVADTDATVLILGESGTGKELIARAIHNISDRNDRPLVKVNCSAIPSNLIESEFFGHERGAFTGAISRKIGRFELAHNGTIFLDEIGDLPLELQSKLLRVLQEGEFERLGNPKTIKVDLRIIAATNRELEKEVERGNFREDLFYRLNVFPILVPPLRQRLEDIPILVKFFVEKFSQKIGKKIKSISQSTIEKLCNYSWPGNVRELENVIERAVILSENNRLNLGNWLNQAANIHLSEPNPQSLDETEKLHILKVLRSTNWRVSGKKGAAKILGINAKTLESRMKKLEIQRPAP
jgi:DNA-binding NtrC family response regulator/ligand-binding sensor domain-containing protein